MRTEKEHLQLDTKKLTAHPINIQVYNDEGIDFRLVDSIEEKGQLEQLVVIEDRDIPGNYVIISGHRRWKALEKLGKEADCRLVSFEDEPEKEEAIKEAIIEYNKYRKKKPSQIVNEAKLLQPIYSKQAKKRQIDIAKQNEDVLNSTQQEEDETDAGKTRDKVAKAVGMGWTKLDILMKIKEKADEGDEHAKILMNKIDNEELTANCASTYMELIEAAKSENPENNYSMKLLNEALLEKTTPYQAVEKLKRLRKKIDTHNQEMQKTPRKHDKDYDVLFADVSNSAPPLEDYMHLKLPDKSPSVLCLLTTTLFLKESFDVMDWWGFEYKSMCIWERDTKASTSWFKGSHEILLIGATGKSNPPSLENKFPSIIRKKKGYECVHEMIKKMFPNQRYIDLLPKGEHEGWDNWILEKKPKFKELESKIEPLFEDFDNNESIKMILMAERKQDGTQDVLDKWY